ncbi:hypothetical protein KOR42_23110 [Thalassoglobus neptunius]|uniref:Uncharacterized protein n=1 Tax=Thalassoglobus neptunius TaxID=1938619 RepID=A0A5C5X7N5_9PLAN|nr:hypothetical protein KOR42_23110 [Thalassoglobus neptunius]
MLHNFILAEKVEIAWVVEVATQYESQCVFAVYNDREEASQVTQYLNEVPTVSRGDYGWDEAYFRPVLKGLNLHPPKGMRHFQVVIDERTSVTCKRLPGRIWSDLTVWTNDGPSIQSEFYVDAKCESDAIRLASDHLKRVKEVHANREQIEKDC